MINKLSKVKELDSALSSVILILRVVIGIAMILHGWKKIQNPFGWMPAEASMQIPAVFQFLAAFSEFGGGIALILGLLNPLTNFGIGITMLTAVYFHMIVLGDPFVSLKGGSYEMALVYFACNLLLFAAGPGKFSLDKLIFGGNKSEKQ